MVPTHFQVVSPSSNGNIFRVTDPLCGEFTGRRWIPFTKASDAELWCFFHLRLNKRLSKQSPSRSLWRNWRQLNWFPGNRYLRKTRPGRRLNINMSSTAYQGFPLQRQSNPTTVLSLKCIREITHGPADGTQPGIVTLIDPSHRYGRHQAACREPAGSYHKTTRTAISFEHKTQYLLRRQKMISPSNRPF